MSILITLGIIGTSIGAEIAKVDFIAAMAELTNAPKAGNATHNATTARVVMCEIPIRNSIAPHFPVFL